MGSLVMLAGVLGCPSDDGGGETGSVASTGAMSTSTGATDSTIGMVEGSGSSGSESTSAAGSSSSGAAVDSSSSGGAPLCEPPVVGEWNSCIDEMGDIDNTLCNWVGNSEATGFLTCLSAPPDALDGGNLCVIRGCRDTCDCFDPPTTGTAQVVCAPILANDETACGLDCSSGETCPDGMECASGLCFWPPAA